MSIAVVVIIVIIIIIISQFQSTGKLPEFLGSNCGGRWGEGGLLDGKHFTKNMGCS